eukprot:7168035-Pyramimonas_sp.AAC.1
MSRQQSAAAKSQAASVLRSFPSPSEYEAMQATYLLPSSPPLSMPPLPFFSVLSLPSRPPPSAPS